jgi:putative oxidoreductase
MKLLLDHPQSRLDVLGKWALRLGVAVLFFFIGLNKFSEHTPFVRIFEQIGFGQWFRYFTGTVQMLGAALVAIPKTFPAGILLLACTMAGAMVAWMVFLGEPVNALIPGVLLGGLVAIGADELMDLFEITDRRG